MTTASLKTWMPLIVVAGGLLSSIILNIVQKANTDAQIAFLVKNMNDSVLPAHEKRIEACEANDVKQNEWDAYQKGLHDLGKVEKGVFYSGGQSVESAMKERGGVSLGVGPVRLDFVPEMKEQKFPKLKTMEETAGGM